MPISSSRLLLVMVLAAAPLLAQTAALDAQRASLEKQLQAVQRQLGPKAQTSHAFIEPLGPPLATTDCPPLEPARAAELIDSAARRQSLDPSLLRAVMKQESAFKPCAVSEKGAQGLMQLMPATAQMLHVSDVFDPAQNTHAGAAYLKQLLDRYKGDLSLALAAYNAGPARASQSDKPYPPETQNYLANIFAELGLTAPAAPVCKTDDY